MKKFLFIVLMLIASNGWCISEWDKTLPAGTTLINDIDSKVGDNNEALDRVLSNYRQGMLLQYLTASTITVTSGEIVCSNSGGTVRKMRSNTSGTTVTWADIDTGAEGSSTTYYVYALCDATATTATFKISTSSSAPSGATYYKRLGSFYNNSSSDIEQMANDNDTVSIATGSIANGATVSLPTGFLNDECDVVISPSDGTNGSNSQAVSDVWVSTYASSARVVTCYRNLGRGASVTTEVNTCKYLIACHR